MTTFDEESGKAILQRRNIITKMRYTTVKCKFCGDWESVVRFGVTQKRTQRYLCQTCGRTFIDNKAPEGMKYPTEMIATALNLFYESASLHKIKRQLKLIYGIQPSHMTIYRWVVRYSQKATRTLNNVPIKVGMNWVADETVLKLKEKGGSNVWFWDIIDDDTRFLLGSHLSDTRKTKDAQILMEKAAKRAGMIPEIVTTDKLASYLDGIELTFGADTKHVQARTLTSEPSKQLIERFHSTLKDRAKVFRSLMRKGTARIITDGWLCHYNFFRPHTSLKDKTPAEAAGANVPFKGWIDIIRQKTNSFGKKEDIK